MRIEKMLSKRIMEVEAEKMSREQLLEAFKLLLENYYEQEEAYQKLIKVQWGLDQM